MYCFSHRYAQHKMRPIVTDVPCCVCLLVATVSCAIAAEPIEMPLGVWSRVSPRDHALGGGARIPQVNGQFWGVA